MIAVSPNLFSRSIGRRRSGWMTVAICLLLFALPFLAAALDGVLDRLIGQPILRPLLLPPVIISYVVLVTPVLARGEAEMLRRLRPVVLVDDDTYTGVVAEASRINPKAEVAAALIGALAGYALTIGWEVEEVPWISAYLTAGLPAMFGVLAWTIYDSLAGTRLIAALHRRPLAIDLLDISPFEPIGRQSLLVTLIFLGGILLGMIFGLDLANIMVWRTFLAYGPLAFCVILLFFLSMRDSHRVLSETKARELEMVGKRLRETGGRFREELAGEETTTTAAAEVAGLLAYERRIRAAPTWPYNPTMLQTLIFSILLPILVKAISWFLFER